MENIIHVPIGGYDTGRLPNVQQYDQNSRVFVCKLWKAPTEMYVQPEPYVIAEGGFVGVVFKWRGAEPSDEYETELVDPSTIKFIVPGAATQRKGEIEMQLVIHENGGVLHGPKMMFNVSESLKRGDRVTEPMLILEALNKMTRKAAEEAQNAAERVEQLQIDASGLAGDSNKLGDKPPSYYLPVENLLVNSNWRNVAKIVNQRGSQLYTRPEYSIDRWVIYTLDGVGAPSLNIATGHVRLGENTYLQQRFPIGFYDNAKLYTVALWYADGGLSVSPITLNRSAEEEFDYFNIFPETKRDISAVAVYEGTYTADTLPPYVPKENEIVSCLQYAYIPMNSQFAIPVSLGGYTSITFPFRMRAIPTVELENLNGVPVEIVEQNEYGVAVINNAESTAQFRVKAFVDL